jgi:hypothetical protein
MILIKLFLSIALFLSPILPVLAEEPQPSEVDPFIYDSHGKRDPLWPLVGPAGNILNYDSDLALSDLALEGIMSDGRGNNVAIVNGKVVNKGDPIGEYKVVDITVDTVTMKKGDQKFEIKLKKKEE